MKVEVGMVFVSKLHGGKITIMELLPWEIGIYGTWYMIRNHDNNKLMEVNGNALMTSYTFYGYDKVVKALYGKK